MAKCNKFKKRWRVMESDTEVFPTGSIYKIMEDEPEVFQVDFEEGGPPPGGSLSIFVCENNELIGSYTDPENSSFPMKMMTLSLDQKDMQGCVGQMCFEAGQGGPQDDPVGTWGAEEDPPTEEKKKDKEKRVGSGF